MNARKRLLVGLVVMLYLAIGVYFVGCAAPVSQQMATEAAYYYLQVSPPPELHERDFTVRVAGELREDLTHRLLGYVFELNPWGYIVVTSETRIVPVIACSGTANFSWEETLQNMLLDILILDLGYRLEAVAAHLAPEANINEDRWRVIGERFARESAPRVYYASYLAQASTTSVGPLMKFPTWNQTTPWNNNCPTDPTTRQTCVTGCVATALAQIINYWQFPSSVTFRTNDNYTSTSTNPGIPITAPTASISNITYSTNPLTNPSNSTMAALSFAAGVSVQMQYSSGISSAATADVAVALAGSPSPWSTSKSSSIWGYTSADIRGYHYNKWSAPYAVSQTTFYNTLRNNMQAGHPEHYWRRSLHRLRRMEHRLTGCQFLSPQHGVGRD